jgi:aerobic carbon-monoxide dehydrogenase large subunit
VSEIDAERIGDIIEEDHAVGRPHPERNVGVTKLRKEDARLVTGHTNWADNIELPGMLHMAVLRSPLAHARITRLDVSPALERPGVMAAFTGQDLRDAWAAPMPCAFPVGDAMVTPDHWPLALDTVRYVGDGVAVVLARDRYEAADALEAIDIEYEPLTPVVNMEEALRDENLVHPDKGTNVCYREVGMESGDLAAAFSGDDTVVVKRRFIQQRLIPAAMEPRALIVAPLSATDEHTIYSSTQIPHILRVLFAVVLGIPEQQLRVIAPDVGGGFGSKLNIYAEELVAIAVARRLGRPVKWTESRSEGFQATIHGRDQIQDLEISATRDGRLKGWRVKLMTDMGAYLQLNTPGIPMLGMQIFPGIYKWDAYEFKSTGIFTNKTPTDAYRGAGRPEATFGLERMMDELAAELGMDPMELRRRNWIAHDEFPFDCIGGLTYDSADYEAATNKAMQLFGYDELRAEQQRRRESGDKVQLGIGISTYTEACGLAPSRALGAGNYGAGGWEAAEIRVLPTGKVEVVTGSSPHGQGHETAWSQIVADALGVGFDDIDVLHGDTKISPLGMDTYGSRSLVVGGVAVHIAAERVLEKARKVAAHMLEASEDDLDFKEGTFQVRGSPEATKTIEEIAFAAWTAHDLPEGVEPNLRSECTFDPINLSFPHGTHLCAAEVDTETGSVAIRKYAAVDDVGNVINPQIVDGQVHGGLAQGIAQALYEEAVYDADGNLVTGTLVDYYVPAAPDLPHFDTDRTETPATTNPLGAKGVGEAGTIASTPAVVNAIVDALRHLGVNDVEMPCSPERVWRAIHDGGAAASDEARPDPQRTYAVPPEVSA